MGIELHSEGVFGWNRLQAGRYERQETKPQ